MLPTRRTASQCFPRLSPSQDQNLCTGSPSLRGVSEPSVVADQGGVDAGASVDEVVVRPGADVDACDVDGVGLEVVLDECDECEVGVAESGVVVVTGGLGLVVVV